MMRFMPLLAVLFVAFCSDGAHALPTVNKRVQNEVEKSNVADPMSEWNLALHGPMEARQTTGDCRLAGYRKRIAMPWCHTATVLINACRGHCESETALSSDATVQASGGLHVYTTRGSCCTIATTHQVTFSMYCWSGVRTYTIESAASCACGVCDYNQ
ncbi:thyrostimulin alpha-2 subunit-like [Branchiostoma floridae]|uniref:Thyrostimulin alpha-2 subunit-like n=1 Tax=Branchiostoma floridae TaxID=7739 RepID=A0A9J7MXJ9_BRAFL|nr:thyrostimulin alpha-2 subunit-like [Branchiostoma floridae]